MIFDYGTLRSSKPIKLSIGITLKKPKISDIEEIGYNDFYLFESFLKMTPKVFYEEMDLIGAKDHWDQLTQEEKDNLTMYQAICENKKLQDIYCEVFKFFIETEYVRFSNGIFFLLKEDVDPLEIEKEEVGKNISGIIFEDIFGEILFMLQQICGVNDDSETPIDEIKFKNKMAKEMYLKMKEAEKQEKKRKTNNPDFYLDNIVSAVSNRHPSINPLNVSELTVFQLLDSFNRLMENAIYEIDSTRVSVWGDEKNTFKASLWYKNRFK